MSSIAEVIEQLYCRWNQKYCFEILFSLSTSVFKNILFLVEVFDIRSSILLKIPGPNNGSVGPNLEDLRQVSELEIDRLEGLERNV